MSRARRVAVLSAAALTALTGVGLVGLPSATAAGAAEASDARAGAFTVDQSHSFVVFRIQHLNTGYSWGRFNDIEGSFLLDKSNPGGSFIDVTVKTQSVDTANAKRDDHLRSPDFFSAKEYPTITFKSKAVRAVGDGFEVDGDLTLRGTTKPITVTIDHAAGPNPGMRGGEIAGFETTFTINRSDFGINYLPQALGEQVRMVVALEGGRE